MNKKELLKIIEVEEKKAKSAWDKGVIAYIYDLIDELDDYEEIHAYNLKEKLLNGAENWEDFSYGGCALIYDIDICERLCNNTEKKRTKFGKKMPNKKENWLDVQARALYFAYKKIWTISFINEKI